MTAPPASPGRRHDTGQVPTIVGGSHPEAVPRLRHGYPGAGCLALLGVCKPAYRAQGSPPVIDEIWRPIPDSEGYEISNRGNVRTVNHLVVRSNGIKYTVAARTRRISVDRRCGLRYVKLATGRRGRYHAVYIRQLLADVFGGDRD
jgi:hypothetical protein